MGAVVIIGLVGIVLGIWMACTLPEEAHNLSRLAGMLTGAGTGICAVALIFTLREKWASPEKRRQMKIEAQDERNQRIWEKTRGVLGISSLFTLMVLAFVLVGIGEVTASFWVLGAIYLQALVMGVAYQIFRKRM